MVGNKKKSVMNRKCGYTTVTRRKMAKKKKKRKYRKSRMVK